MLLIGASYFAGHGFTHMLQALADSGHKKLYIGEEIVSGLLLRDHRKRPQTLHRIQSETWNDVVLCDAAPGAAYEALSPPRYPLKVKSLTHESLLYYFEQVKKAKAKPLFVVPWAFEDGMTWVKGMTDTYEQMQTIIDANCAGWAKDTGMAMAPVGPAFRKLMRTHKELHYL